MPALKLSIRRTHVADRTNSAVHALCHPGTLSFSHIEQELVPPFANASRANVVGLLMRDHADAHVAVWIDSKRLYTAATRVHGRCGINWLGKFITQHLPVLRSHFWPVQIQR